MMSDSLCSVPPLLSLPPSLALIQVEYGLRQENGLCVDVLSAH